MASRNLQRLSRWLAFAATLLVPVVVLLAPRLAFAALLPACESHEVTPTPPEWLAMPTILPDSCTLGEIRNDEDPGDPRVAAMCSESGASVVAPPRVVPIVDARIEASSGCTGEISAPVCGPSSHDTPLGQPAFAVLDHAMLGDGLLIPPATSELAPPFRAAAGMPRAGVKHAVEHPPR
ncbi:Hypothetical protein A7982_05645 [Minicystis rosea]|nr:Hypothetical protein A7982_05645 [Minicystis rosea]